MLLPPSSSLSRKQGSDEQIKSNQIIGEERKRKRKKIQAKVAEWGRIA